jgi:hypothetical protein
MRSECYNMISHYLNFLKDGSTLTLYITLDIPAINFDYKMDIINFI